jgi:hypothetical protein
LKAWHNGAWAATFGISLFILVQVLLRPNATELGPSHAPLITTIVLFALFAGGSLWFRQHFVDKRRRQADAAATIALVTPGPPDSPAPVSPALVSPALVSPTADPAPERP